MSITNPISYSYLDPSYNFGNVLHATYAQEAVTLVTVYHPPSQCGSSPDHFPMHSHTLSLPPTILYPAPQV